MRDSTKAQIAAEFNSDMPSLNTISFRLYLGEFDPHCRNTERYLHMIVDGHEVARFIGINSAAAWIKQRSGALGGHGSDDRGRYRDGIYFELQETR